MNLYLRKLNQLVSIAVCLLAMAAMSGRAAETGKIRVLVVVGGHDFETNQFHAMFKANHDISYEMVEHPKALARLRPESAKDIDVLVLYDMWQKINDQEKADFVNFLKSGKGLVAVHHSIANYQKWPEYEKIVGGRYYLDKTMVNGVEKPRSTWKHDVMIKVQVANTQHPVTQGVKDWTIHDEAYGKFDMAPASVPLLTTEEPLSAKNIAWANEYEKAKVVFIQLGHDHYAYEDPNYRRLLANAIRWTAGK